jgi:hypothetical protein
MTNPNKVTSLVPQDRSVAIDRVIDDARPTDLAAAVGSVTADMKHALSAMSADDLTFEFDGHSSPERSSARVRIRAYKHRSNGST